jgi:ABC-type oligopeptide transport system substrate-binding subunit
MRKFVSLLALVVIGVIVSAAAAQDGQGLVRVNVPLPVDGVGSLVAQTAPSLYVVDGAIGNITGATDDNLALVLQPQYPGDDIETLRIRDDLTWSDGTPVTAYDVLLGILWSGENGYFAAVGLIDDHTLDVRHNNADCPTLARSNLRFSPAHRLNWELPAFARELSAGRSEPIAHREWRDAWQARFPGRSFPLLADPSRIPSVRVTNFDYSVYTQQYDLTSIYNIALRTQQVPGGSTAVEQFLTSETNLLLAPPFNRRADLRFREDLQIYEQPGWAWDYLTFNFADPAAPRDAYDRDGNLLDQGVHPAFADVRVRRAIQLGIDVDAIIDIVFGGSATRNGASLPPVSWAHNPDIPLTAYDPVEAARLLDDAGWVDSDGDGVRNCYRCQHATEGRQLSLNIALGYSDGAIDRVQELIALQLGQIGIRVGYGGYGNDQRFDLFLGGHDTRSDLTLDPDQTLYFTRAGDRVGATLNVGSYHNPVVEALFTRARTVEGCNVETRAAIYRDIQQLLADDVVVVPLYTRHDFYAARGIVGFAPRPGDPFAGLFDWVVTP